VSASVQRSHLVVAGRFSTGDTVQHPPARDADFNPSPSAKPVRISGASSDSFGAARRHARVAEKIHQGGPETPTRLGTPHEDYPVN
jgi:hypothetical protein